MENDNGEKDHINKTYIGVDMETNIQNIACLGKAIPPYNKQRLGNIWCSILKKLKKALLKKKARIGLPPRVSVAFLHCLFEVTIVFLMFYLFIFRLFKVYNDAYMYLNLQ